MAHVSKAVIAALALIGLAGSAQENDPDKVLGTKEGNYELFEPVDIVRAGSAGVASAYRFFAQPTLNVPTVTTSVAIASSGDGYKWTLLAATEYSDGLIFGPFHTTYEGTIQASVDAGNTLRLEVTAKHTFQDGKTLSSTRSDVIRRTTRTFTLSEFTSITQLVAGDVRADDGTMITITAALLAQPVTIELSAELVVLDGAGNRRAGNLTGLQGEASVAFFQLAVPITGRSLEADVVPTPPAAGTVGVNAVDGVVTWAEWAALVLQGIPALSGEAGNCLRADAKETGLQWGECGSGSGGGTTVLSGTRTPTAEDGADGNYWIAALSNGSKLEVWENVEGTWVELAEASETTAFPGFGTSAPATARPGPSTVGTAATASRSDHHHGVAGIVGLPPTKNVANVGDIAVVTAADTTQTPAVIQWRKQASDVVPKALAASAAVGLDTLWARGDHVHPNTGLATDAAITAAVAKVRAVPDPSHNAAKDVLTILADGTYGWQAAPAGGGSGGSCSFTKLHTLTLPKHTNAENFDYRDTGASAVTVAAAVIAKQKTATPYHGFNIWEDGRQQSWTAWVPEGISSSGSVVRVSLAGQVPDESIFNSPASGILEFDSTQIRWRMEWTGAETNASKDYDVYGIECTAGGGGGDKTPLSDGIPKALEASGSSGTGTAASRGDHVHPASLSDDAPKIAGTAAGGTSTNGSRADHVHPANVSDANPNALASAADAGEATAASRADHVHPTTGIRQPPAYQNVPSSLGYDINYVLGFSRCLASSPGSNNETCALSWQKPVRWQRVFVGSSAPTDFSGTGSFTISEDTYALQAFMQNTLTAFQKFELYLKFTHSGAEHWYMIDISGTPEGTAQSTDEATYYSVNSNNSLTGNTQWARLEVGSTTHTVTYHINSQGESSVQARIYGYR